jgi:AraC-like DNA-binding protein
MKEDQDLLYIVSVTVLLIISIVLTAKRRNLNPLAGVALTVYFWCFFLTILIAYIVLSPLIKYVPHLFRTANIFLLLIFPFSWLYFKQTLQPGRLGWKYVVHLLPALVYIADFIPLFLMPGSEKLAIINSLDAYGLKAGYAEGWFVPKGIHNIIRYSIMAGYWLAQGLMLWRAVKLSSSETGKDYKVHRKWLIWLQFSQMLIFVPSLITVLIGRLDIMIQVSNLFGLIATLIQGGFLFANPIILYGLPVEHEDQISESSVEVQIKGVLEVDGKPAYIDNIDEETAVLIDRALDKVMVEKQLFKNPDLRISDLAMASGFLSYKLSAYFRKRLYQNFYDYVNGWRINYCTEMIDSGQFRVKTLEALASESGFRSRSTFIRAFKKVKDMTPSNYIHNLK